MFMLVCFVYDIVPYQESTTLHLYAPQQQR